MEKYLKFYYNRLLYLQDFLKPKIIMNQDYLASQSLIQYLHNYSLRFNKQMSHYIELTYKLYIDETEIQRHKKDHFGELVEIFEMVNSNCFQILDKKEFRNRNYDEFLYLKYLKHNITKEKLLDVILLRHYFLTKRNKKIEELQNKIINTEQRILNCKKELKKYKNELNSISKAKEIIEQAKSQQNQNIPQNNQTQEPQPQNNQTQEPQPQNNPPQEPQPQSEENQFQYDSIIEEMVTSLKRKIKQKEKDIKELNETKKQFEQELEELSTNSGKSLSGISRLEKDILTGELQRKYFKLQYQHYNNVLKKISTNVNMAIQTTEIKNTDINNFDLNINNYINLLSYEYNSLTGRETSGLETDIYLDISGSMRDYRKIEVLKIILNYLFDKTKVKGKNFYAFNNELKKIRKEEVLYLQADGGTDFKLVIENIKKSKNIALILTDIEGIKEDFKPNDKDLLLVKDRIIFIYIFPKPEDFLFIGKFKLRSLLKIEKDEWYRR